MAESQRSDNVSGTRTGGPFSTTRNSGLVSDHEWATAGERMEAGKIRLTPDREITRRV